MPIDRRRRLRCLINRSVGQPLERFVGDAGAFADRDEDLGVGHAVGKVVVEDGGSPSPSGRRGG